eukprot:472491-Alexandrium_andersonii.AAC.1
MHLLEGTLKHLPDNWTSQTMHSRLAESHPSAAGADWAAAPMGHGNWNGAGDCCEGRDCARCCGAWGTGTGREQR